MRPLPAFLLGLSALGLVGWKAAGATNAEDEAALGPTVVVSGSGEIKSDPDLAIVRIGVQADGTSARDAQTKVSASTQKLIAEAAKLVDDRRDIQTSDLSLYPRQGDNGKIVGYQARNVVTVRLKKLDRVGPLVDAGVSVGATNVEGVSFGLQDDSPAQSAALTEAVKDARRKADALAAGLGMRVGDVVTVTEGGGGGPRPMMMGMADSVAFAKTPVEGGQVGTGASVTVRYKLVK